jgi:hypothetical protein
MRALSFRDHQSSQAPGGDHALRAGEWRPGGRCRLGELAAIDPPEIDPEERWVLAKLRRWAAPHHFVFAGWVFDERDLARCRIETNDIAGREPATRIGDVMGGQPDRYSTSPPQEVYARVV